MKLLKRINMILPAVAVAATAPMIQCCASDSRLDMEYSTYMSCYISKECAPKTTQEDPTSIKIGKGKHTIKLTCSKVKPIVTNCKFTVYKDSGGKAELENTFTVVHYFTNIETTKEEHEDISSHWTYNDGSWVDTDATESFSNGYLKITFVLKEEIEGYCLLS